MERQQLITGLENGKGSGFDSSHCSAVDPVRSFYFDQDEILRGIIKLYCPDGFECDMTYGNGTFWRNIPRPKYCYDIDPQKPEAVKADSQLLPHDPESLQNVVFDPPFLTYVKKGRGHANGKVAMTARFGGYYRYDELEEHYRHTISEAYRVLKPKGIMVFKCQDIIHNHRMPGPQKGTQRHARVWHSYFIVLEKN